LGREEGEIFDVFLGGTGVWMLTRLNNLISQSGWMLAGGNSKRGPRSHLLGIFWDD